MFANVTKDGLGITVHNSLASTWITVQVTRFLLYIMNVWSFNLVRKYRSNLSAKKGCLFTYFIFFKMKGQILIHLSTFYCQGFNFDSGFKRLFKAWLSY